MNVGENIKAPNASWSFGGDVAHTFEAHVAKSVPLYKKGHDLVLGLSDFFLHNNSIAYEIGCSTGILSNAIAERHQHKNITVNGIDIEPAMIEYANKHYSDTKGVRFECADVLEAQLEPSDLIISYYTIQFIKPKVRQIVIDSIYDALNWGGAFLFFEKVRAPDARFQDIMTALYTDYKLDSGYSPEEIISKSRSLKGVLEPFSTQGNLDLLERAGFKDVMTVMKHVCFEGFLAIK
jgi:tRNA (cmo5U34)-methyltransferase